MDTSEVRRISEQARPDLSSYRNCQAINDTIAESLQDHGYTVCVVEGRLTRYELRGEGPEHAFVLLERDSGRPIIVDGAIQQFCTERKNAGEVFFSLGSKDSLPLVAVLTPSDDLYENYLF